MRREPIDAKDAAERTVRDIRRRIRKQHSAEEKIRIVLAGLRGEESIAALCPHEWIAESLYYSWSKEFLEAGKKRLAGDTERQANSNEVKELRCEMRDMKELVADLTLENQLLKKSTLANGRRRRMRYPASEKLEDRARLPSFGLLRYCYSGMHSGDASPNLAATIPSTCSCTGPIVCGSYAPE